MIDVHADLFDDDLEAVAIATSTAREAAFFYPVDERGSLPYKLFSPIVPSILRTVCSPSV